MALLIGYSQPGASPSHLSFVGEPHPEGGERPSAPAVLVVDDEPFVREMVARVLRRAGLTILEARNGAEAVEQLHHHPEIQLVLLDWFMPGWAGERTVTELRRVRPEVPIILSSGEPIEVNQNEFVAILAKPYPLDVLARTVSTALAVLRPARALPS